MAKQGKTNASPTLADCMKIWRCGRRGGKYRLVEEMGYSNIEAARNGYSAAERRLLKAGKIERRRYLSDTGLTDEEIVELIALYSRKGPAELVKEGYAKTPSSASWLINKLRLDLPDGDAGCDIPDRWSIFKANAGLVPAFGSSASEEAEHAGK